MNKNILRIAIPSIISNITVPLLALVDTTIVGHLGAASYIGAIAVGSMLFNMAYWLFGFLRMGTGGLTAQAYGSGSESEMHNVLLRSLSVGFGIALMLFILQRPIADIAFLFITATPEVESLARIYYNILIWGAPAVLCLYSFIGWFLGMQNAKYPMLIAIVQNVVNIAASLSLVYGLGWKVEGVALGTLIAQYGGLLMAVLLWYRKYRNPERKADWKSILDRNDLKKFFNVNRDIFFRTLCLIAVTTYFTSRGAALGDLSLAANTLLMQFFIIFSYIMDGFAYAAEAISGKYFGARETGRFRQLTRRLFVWGIVLSVLFTIAYLFGGHGIISLLTNEQKVINLAMHYLPFAIAIPLISFAAFLYDGLFIGTTSTHYMLSSMAFAAATFFVTLFILPPTNTSLWIAFLVYLGGRGSAQAFLYKKVVAKFNIGSK